MLTLLDHKDSGAFSEHEAVAVAVPRARREGWFVIPKRHSAHRTEARHAKWRDGRLRASADHDIGVAVLNDSVGFPDGVRSGGACRSRRQVRSGSSPTNRDLSSSQIDDRRRDKEWGNTSRALARELRMFALDGLETSNATSHENSDSVRMFRLHIETSMSNCELGGGQGKVDESGGFLDVLFLHKIEGVESRNLTSNTAGEGGCVEECHGPDS